MPPSTSRHADDVTPDEAEMIRIATALAEAKSRQDIEAAMRIYHQHGVLEAPPFGSRSEGADEIRTSLERFFALFPDYSVDLAGAAADGDTLAAWGEIAVTLTGRPGGQTPNGRRARIPVLILFRFDSGRVAWESFNFDLGSLCRQSGVTLEAFAIGKAESR